LPFVHLIFTLQLNQVEVLEQVTPNLDWVTQARPLWIEASRDFAASASGQVHVFQNSAGISITSIWATVEYPTLISNPNVSEIIYHVIMPNGKITIMK
jgi:hypothetical protein